MAKQVIMGATLSCSFGTAPSKYLVPPGSVYVHNVAPGRIIDQRTMVNVSPFGMCTSLANPQVAAATSASGGTLTPVPCIPQIRRRGWSAPPPS